jgi:hypothetical protein
MQKWEYRLHWLTKEILAVPHSEEVLHRLGSDGWELVAVVEQRSNDNSVLCFFKRPQA